MLYIMYHQISANETTMRYDHKSIRMAKTQNTDNAHAGEDLEQEL